MKRPLLIVGIVLVVLCGIGAVVRQGLQAAAAKLKNKPTEYTVTRGDIEVKVVDTGTIDAVKSVEVKSRVQGRVKKLFVNAGDVVQQGQLIAVIDPQETELQLQQSRAQLRGAMASVRRSRIELDQRKITARANYDRAKIRVAQLELELKAQPALTKSAVEAAETSYKAALQRRDKLVKVTQPNERAAVETGLDDAKASLENAQRESERKKNLYDKGYVSLRELQDAQLQVQLAKSKLETQNQRLDRLRMQEDLERKEAEEQIAQARAELDRALTNRFQDKTKRQEYDTALSQLRDAEAALRDPQLLQASAEQSQATVDQISSSVRDAERLLGETEIRSPITGIVTSKLVQEGELVASLSSFSSGTAIVRIEDRQAMLVKLNINEIDVAKLKLDMPANVEVDAIPGKVFKGRVTKIAPAVAAPASGQQTGQAVVRYEVEIRLDEQEDRLKSGMTAKCTVMTSQLKDVVKVAAEYVGKDEKGRFVMISGGTGPGAKPTRRDIKIGTEAGASVEVVEGLKAGEKLVKPDYKGPDRKGMMGP